MKKHYKIRVIVDDDVKLKYTIKDSASVEFYVVVYLNDPSGWTKKGYSFEPVTTNEDILIRLSSPDTVTKICGLPNNLSCAEFNGKHIYLNSDRWFHGASKSRLSLDNYRQYMISHEVGHILGFDHQNCTCEGCKAPIMMQQTLGIGKCIPNTKVTNG
jgi:hypothetical protein